jgi:hypothetical protein
MTWVDNRENDIKDIMARLKVLQSNGVIVTLDRNPDGKLTTDDMDAVLLYEGPDSVIVPGRTKSDGDQKREMSFVTELWVYSSVVATRHSALRNLYNESRKVILKHNNVAENSATQVYTSGVPGVLGMGVVYKLKYINQGL